MSSINQGQKCEHQQFLYKLAQSCDGVSQYLNLDQKITGKLKFQLQQSKWTSDSVSQAIHQNSTFSMCSHDGIQDKNGGIQVQKIKHKIKDAQNVNFGQKMNYLDKKNKRQGKMIKDPDYNQNEQPKYKPSYKIKGRKEKKCKQVKQNRKNLKKNAFQQIARAMKSCIKKKLKNLKKSNQYQEIEKYKQNKGTIDSILNSIDWSILLEQIFRNQQIQEHFQAEEQQRLFNIKQLKVIKQKFFQGKVIDSHQKDQQIIYNQI